jgi:hypothetical protein
MVNKIICEELFEDFEPPFALNFFGVSSNDCLRVRLSDSPALAACFYQVESQ